MSEPMVPDDGAPEQGDPGVGEDLLRLAVALMVEPEEHQPYVGGEGSLPGFSQKPPE